MFDAGREVSGHCMLVLRAETDADGAGTAGPASGSDWCTAGTVVKTIYAETLYDNGTVMPTPTVPDRKHGGREQQMARYECAGDPSLDPPVVPNRFMYTGYRYIGVEGWKGSLPS